MVPVDYVSGAKWSHSAGYTDRKLSSERIVDWKDSARGVSCRVTVTAARRVVCTVSECECWWEGDWHVVARDTLGGSECRGVS